MSFRYLAASLTLLAFVGACSDDEAELRWDPKRSTIAISHSDVLPADGESSFDIAVVVRDSLKAPQANVPVFLQVEEGIGTVITQPGRTDKKGAAHGHVSSTVFGPKQISVWAGEGRGRVLLGTRNLKFVAGDAAAIQVLGLRDDLRAGDVFNARAQIVDSSGNVVTTADDLEIKISLLGNDAGAQLSGTKVAKPYMGIVTFPGLSIRVPGQGLQFEMSAEGMESVRSLPFDVSIGNVGGLRIEGAPLDMIVGTPLSALTVSAVDAFGNLLVDKQMTVRISLEGIGELGGQTERSLVDGKAVFEDLTIDREGEFRLIATAGDLEEATDFFLVEEVGAAPVRILTAGTQTVEQQGRISVLARDDEGKRMAGVLVEMSSEDDSLTFKPRRGLTNKDGLLAVTVTTTKAGTHAIQALVGGDDGVVAEAELQFTAGKPSNTKSSLTLSAEAVEVGEILTVDVLVEDDFNNPVSGVVFRLGKVGSASVDFTVSPDASFTTDEDGMAQLEITGDVAGLASVGLFQGTSNVPMIRMPFEFLEAEAEIEE